MKKSVRREKIIVNLNWFGLWETKPKTASIYMSKRLLGDITEAK